MSVITIFSASHCQGEKIAQQAAQQLGYELLGDEILQEASERFNIAYDKLIRAMKGAPSLFNNVTHEKERCVAYIKIVFAEAIKKNNLVYHGFAGHLLPQQLKHILKVCIVADPDYRIQRLVEKQNLTEKKASAEIEKDDIEHCRWTQYLFDLGPWDKKLYDIKIPIHEITIDDAVQMICDNEKKISQQIDYDINQAMNDFHLASKVSLALINKGYNFDVKSNQGHVTILINEYSWRLERLQSKLKDIASAVEGVKSVEARVGTGYNQPHIDRYDFEVHPKVLLVDDEKEYVLTLSERLQMRNISSQVVYNGEEALSFVRNKEEPDVMILDLMMPGINGIEVLRQVKKEHPNIEVIILTGHGTEKDQALAEELGAFAYLQKPANIDQLEQTMKAAYQKIQEKMGAKENQE